jgi:hypothetical protein
VNLNTCQREMLRLRLSMTDGEVSPLLAGEGPGVRFDPPSPAHPLFSSVGYGNPTCSVA